MSTTPHVVAEIERLAQVAATRPHAQGTANPTDLTKLSEALCRVISGIQRE